MTLPGEYVCGCPAGFFNEDEHTCIKVDGCKHNDGNEKCGGPTYPTAPLFGVCFPGDGADTSYTCQCSPGYYFKDDACVEYNPCECIQSTCADSDGAVRGECINEAPPSDSFHCSCQECYEEVEGSGKCTNIDYCADNLFCNAQGDEAAKCLDKECDYSCQCTEAEGWELSSFTNQNEDNSEFPTCSNKDYCPAEPDPFCTCVDNFPSPTDGRSYQLTNCQECYKPVPADAAQCEADPNSCNWKSAPIDQCSSEGRKNGLEWCSRHDKGAGCTSSTEGETCGFECICSQGWEQKPGDDFCSDIDECAVVGLAECRKGGAEDAKCAHGEGDSTYVCDCGTGYQCTDDACTACKEVETCSNAKCAMGKCVDHKPSAGNPWSFSCDCNQYYEAVDTADCGDSFEEFTRGKALREDGSYEAIADGETDYCGQQCVDIDECATGGQDSCRAGSASATCSQGVGTGVFTCDCQTGFECTNRHTCTECVEVNPCEENDSLCQNGKCVDNEPDSEHPWSYSCACAEGYDSVLLSCDAPHFARSKFAQSLELADQGEPAYCGQECVDHPDCTDGGEAQCRAAHDATATCVEGPAGSGKHSCECSAGFQCNDADCTLCLPIDVCAAVPDLCQRGKCVDDVPEKDEGKDRNWESFTCDCNECYTRKAITVKELTNGESVSVQVALDISHDVNYAEVCVDVDDCSENGSTATVSVPRTVTSTPSARTLANALFRAGAAEVSSARTTPAPAAWR